MRKLYENFHIFHFQKRIVSSETILGNTVPIFSQKVAKNDLVVSMSVKIGHTYISGFTIFSPSRKSSTFSNTKIKGLWYDASDLKMKSFNFDKLYDQLTPILNIETSNQSLFSSIINFHRNFLLLSLNS